MISPAWILVFLALSFRYTLGDNESPVAHCIDDETSCTRGCQPGYRGSFCNETCSEHCGGACSQDTGHCLTGCKPNWFTSTCSQPCSGNCVDDVCDRRSAECFRGCKDGFYGLNCNETCSGNCTEGKCDIYGGCHCKKGVLDKFCYIDCTDNCKGGLCDEDQDGQLKCLKGCKAGRMGPFCNEWCPYDCPACDSTCVSRVMKRRFIRESPNNCRENSTCQDGYRGPDCDISCPDCRYKANCSLYCAGGSWGEECHLPCPQNCSRSTNGKSLCEDGICISGCLQGYFGHSCELKCSSTCNKNYCFRTNGRCSNGCHPSYWGQNCTSRCGNCLDMKCEQNGSCICIDKYYGRRCEDKCSEGCDGNCSISNDGNHKCNGECKTRFSGVDCKARCPKGCQSNGCGRENGSCVETSKETTNDPPIAAIIAIVLSIIVGTFVVILYLKFNEKCCFKKPGSGDKVTYDKGARNSNSNAGENSTTPGEDTPDLGSDARENSITPGEDTPILGSDARENSITPGEDTPILGNTSGYDGDSGQGSFADTSEYICG